MYFAIFILALLALMFVGFGIGGAEVFHRKLWVALFTSILAIITMNILEFVPSDEGSLFVGIIVYSAFILPVIFFYGVMASILSDKISLNAKNYPTLFSFALHLLFGLLFILPYGVLFEGLPFLHLNIVDSLINPVTGLSVSFALTFFVFDHMLKLRSDKSSVSEKSA